MNRPSAMRCPTHQRCAQREDRCGAQRVLVHSSWLFVLCPPQWGSIAVASPELSRPRSPSAPRSGIVTSATLQLSGPHKRQVLMD
eukprot:2347358-Prymnesium_polylepis.2